MSQPVAAGRMPPEERIAGASESARESASCLLGPPLPRGLAVEPQAHMVSPHHCSFS